MRSYNKGDKTDRSKIGLESYHAMRVESLCIINPPLILSPPAPLDYLELWIDFCSAQAASPSIASRGVFGSKTRPLVPPGEAGEMKTVWGSPGWVVRVHHRLRKLLTYFRLETTEMCGFKAAIVGVTMAEGGLRSWVCGCGGRAILTIRAPNRTDRRAL